jgi:penicillin-binding protein 1B
MPNNIKPKSSFGKAVNGKRQIAAPTVAAYKAHKRGIFRRLLRLIFNPVTLGLFLFSLVGAFLAGTYFWFEYSERVDGLLRGDVFTRSAGVYSAPKTLKVGEGMSPDSLAIYLKSAGYIEKNSQADPARSRYAVGEGNVIDIEPGDTGMIDGRQLYQKLRVKFDKTKKSVASITTLEDEKSVQSAQLEPKILSSITTEENGRRKVIGFKDIPPHLVKAIIVTEDRSFFEHYGVNIRGIARAIYRRIDDEDISAPIARQGGSSITQQLVKNLLLSSEKSYERKAKEALMSVILETRLSKEQIFELYANQIYLGQQAGFSIYGVGEGANTYFGKDVSALTLGEAAFLAGIIRSPNRYNPYKDLEKSTERRNQVLESMLETGAINAEQSSAARDEKINLVQLAARKELLDMPYFTTYAEQQLAGIVADPEALQHLRVYTTIDIDLQRAAYNAVTKRLERLDKYFPKREKGSLQAALVAIKPKTGEIVAMIGGRDFLQNQFNRATEAMRQPGSVFKPFVYAAALNTAYDFAPRVITAASVFKDEKKTFTFNNETYEPGNYGDFFSNKETTFRDALVKSKNVITVDMAMEVNVGKVMNLAAKAGFPRAPRAYPSMALGTAEATPLQVATAYTTFANGGQRATPIAVNRVTTGDGRTVTAPTTQKGEVIKPDVSYIMTDIMKDVINKGTAVDLQAYGFKNSPGRLGYAGKTGTSRDGWFAGYTPDLVCVVYVGFDDGSDLGMKGADSALPIWGDFMRQALDLHPEWNGDWAMPEGIRKAEIDTRNGKLIRELTDNEAANMEAVKNAKPDANKPAPLAVGGDPEALVEKINSDVPAEFRRVELFVSGTVPNRDFAPKKDEDLPGEDDLPKPTPTPGDALISPVDELEKQQQKDPPKDIPKKDPDNITVMICPITNLRATSACSDMTPKKFKHGEEPKKSCGTQFHTKLQ